MSKSKYTEKEIDLLDKLKHENRKLKRELKVARKMLDRYGVAEEKGLIDERVIMPSKKRHKEKELSDKWRCHDCEIGVLELIIIGNRYFRKCNHCDKHTKSQLWEDAVKGVTQGEGQIQKR